ncbi:MAG TPA: capsule biosynthesis protein [Usitatibacteraceae bacterium]
MDAFKRLLKKISPIFALTVLVPTSVAIIYYGLIASDIYISESRFVVRSPQRQSQTGLLSSLLSGTGFSRSQDDAYSVHDFIKSRDALKALDKQLGLQKKFSAPDVDFLNRFGTLDRDKSFEALQKYYQKRVTVDADSTSGISILQVSAFTAADAQKISEMLLDMSETLVNKLSDRGRDDILRTSLAEVAEAEKKAKAAALALAAFRNQNSVVDPEKQTQLQLLAMSKLQEEQIATETQLNQLLAFAPDNPQIPSLRNRMQTLQKAVDGQLQQMSGKGGSLTNKAAEYERLALDRAYADKQLAVNLAALDSARSEAQRKQLYLERIVQPNLPDVAIEPRRFRSIVIVFVLGLVAWGILTLLVASVREHME